MYTYYPEFGYAHSHSCIEKHFLHMYRGVYGHVYRNTFYTEGFLEYYTKLTRCVEVMYPPHVESVLHACVGINIQLHF